MPLLELRNITKSYTQNTDQYIVLSNIDFILLPGKIVSIVGQSGSGKSTLLHILGLLDKPTVGSILIHGQDCTGLNDNAITTLRRSNIGFVYQFHHLLPEFTAIENLTLAQKIANTYKNDTNAVNLLKKFGLEHREHHYPAQLSGGEKQRVAIARGLINQPKILLADEPTGNLDQDSADVVFQLLLENARQRDVSTIIVTHNLALAEKTDRVLILEHGKLKDR